MRRVAIDGALPFVLMTIVWAGIIAVNVWLLRRLLLTKNDCKLLNEQCKIERYFAGDSRG